MGVKSGAEKRTVEDLLNEAILHVDIGMEGLVIIHDPPAFDQKPVALQTKKGDGKRGGTRRGEDRNVENQCMFPHNKDPVWLERFRRKASYARSFLFYI